MRKILIAGAVLAALPAIAQPAKTPFTARGQDWTRKMACAISPARSWAIP